MGDTVGTSRYQENCELLKNNTYEYREIEDTYLWKLSSILSYVTKHLAAYNFD